MWTQTGNAASKPELTLSSASARRSKRKHDEEEEKEEEEDDLRPDDDPLPEEKDGFLVSCKGVCAPLCMCTTGQATSLLVHLSADLRLGLLNKLH